METKDKYLWKQCPLEFNPAPLGNMSQKSLELCAKLNQRNLKNHNRETEHSHRRRQESNCFPENYSQLAESYQVAKQRWSGPLNLNSYDAQLGIPNLMSPETWMICRWDILPWFPAPYLKFFCMPSVCPLLPVAVISAQGSVKVYWFANELLAPLRNLFFVKEL